MARPTKLFTEEEKRIGVEAYLNGESLDDIQAKIGYTNLTQFYKILDEANVPRRTNRHKGKKSTTKVCPNCGKKLIGEGVNYCFNCGADVRDPIDIVLNTLSKQIKQTRGFLPTVETDTLINTFNELKALIKK